MSWQMLTKLDAIQTAIASLRAEVGGLQAQVSAKAESTAVSALSSTVQSQGTMITSQSGMISAQGQAITTLTSTLDLPCGCNKAAATAETALETRIQSASRAISIDFGKGVITIANPNGPIVLANLDAAEGRQVFISETSVASAAIATEVSARASSDEVLCSRSGALSSALNGSDLADMVRQVIRKELQPGGLLHRR